MKICNVSMFYHPQKGGQENYIKDLIKIFDEKGIKSIVIQPKNNYEKPIEVIYPPMSIPFKDKFSHFFDKFNWIAFNIELLFSKNILRDQDVIISHYAFHYGALKQYKKLISLSHGVLWNIPAKTFFDKLFIKYNKQILKSGSTIVSNDTEYIRMLGIDIKPGENYFKEVQKNVWFIPNCVDTNIFVNKKLQKEKVILVPRNIRKNRGIHLAIEAFAILNERVGGFKLQIVGKGASGEYFDYCKKLIDKFNIQDQVEFKDHAKREEMVNYFNKATLTLIPTIEKEGTSLSAIESMSCGTATVSTAIGGLKDLPTIQSSLDPKDIAQKMEYAIKNLDKVSLEQETKTRNIFNMNNWSKAWLLVTDKVSEK